MRKERNTNLRNKYVKKHNKRIYTIQALTTGVAKLILDEVDFTAKIFVAEKTLYNDKRINLPGKYNDHKDIWT